MTHAYLNCYRNCEEGLLNSTEPGADEKQEGWYNTQSKYWVERSKYFFDIVDYFGTIVCVSEKFMLSKDFEFESEFNLLATKILWQY